MDLTQEERDKLLSYAATQSTLDPRHTIEQLEFMYKWSRREGWSENVDEFLRDIKKPLPLKAKGRRR